MVLRSGKYLVFAITCLSLLSLGVTKAQAQSGTSADRVQRPAGLKSKVTAPPQDKGVVAPRSKDLANFNAPTPVKVVFKKVTNKGEAVYGVWFEIRTRNANGTGEVSQTAEYVLRNDRGYAVTLPDLITPNKELTFEYGKDLLTLRVTARATSEIAAAFAPKSERPNWTQSNTATDEFDLTRYAGKVTVPFKLVSARKPGGQWDWLVPEFEVTGYLEINRPEKVREGGIDTQIKDRLKPPPRTLNKSRTPGP